MLTLKDQKNFFKNFFKFWGDIWEKDDRTPEIPWVESVSNQLRAKIASVNELNILVENLEKETEERKNWTAPGIDRIQNFWWTKLKPARMELKRAFEQVKDKNDLILA